MLLLAILSPIISAFLLHLMIFNCKKRILKLLFLLFFSFITIYFSITTLGPEGPFYRLFVSIIVATLFVYELINTIQLKEKMKLNIFYLIFLLIVFCLLFFSDGVCML